jgi:hypothetical protein
MVVLTQEKVKGGGSKRGSKVEECRKWGLDPDKLKRLEKCRAVQSPAWLDLPSLFRVSLELLLTPD